MRNRAILIFCILIFFVIALGAYTRLKDAGLGCPDWPGCYGQLIAPDSVEQIDSSRYSVEMFDTQRAWIEMIHRYVASLLGMVCFYFIIQSLFKKKDILLAAGAFCVLCFQGYLGMLTVTMKLQPLIVTGHLLGGFSFLFIAWMWHLKMNIPMASVKIKNTPFKLIGLFFLYVVQVLLGAWTSTNYAATSCLEIFSCGNEAAWKYEDLLAITDLQGLWFSSEALSFFSSGQKVLIHLVHRFHAIFLGLWLAYVYTQAPLYSSQKNALAVSFFLYLLQVIIALAMINWHFPLIMGVLHNLVAALLGVSILTALYYACFENKRDSVYFKQRVN